MPHLLPLDRPVPLFDLAATRRIEAAAQAALAPHTLMQRAGLATARLALALAPHARTVWIACGPGNNGGDGLEAAMHLQHWGLRPVVTWLGEEARLPPDARASLQRARDARVRFADQPPVELGPDDLAIDALLGIGAMRPPQGRMAEWLVRLRSGPATLLALDVPSGLDADRGALCLPIAPDSIAAGAGLDCANGQFPLDLPPAARHTLSLLTCKPGLFTAQGRDACGTLWFDDLGVDPGEQAPVAWLNAAPQPAPRPHDSHKGSYGDVAVIGGASDVTRGVAMTGAALLAASAALHGGAGRVYVGLLGTSTPAFDPTQPELMFRHPDALPLAQLTVVCGCGGGEAVRALLPAVGAPGPGPGAHAAPAGGGAPAGRWRAPGGGRPPARRPHAGRAPGLHRRAQGLGQRDRRARPHAQGECHRQRPPGHAGVGRRAGRTDRPPAGSGPERL